MNKTIFGPQKPHLKNVSVTCSRRYKLLATNPGTRGMVDATQVGGWIADPVTKGWVQNLSTSSGLGACGACLPLEDTACPTLQIMHRG